MENAQMFSAKQPDTVRGKINANTQVFLFGKILFLAPIY